MLSIFLFLGGVLMKFLSELYYLKKTVLMVENLDGEISRIKSLLSEFRLKNPFPATEEQLITQVRDFKKVLNTCIPIVIKEKWEYSDYSVYTDKLHHRKFWNEIENDSSVNYFLDAFIQIKNLGDSKLPYMLLLYDFNDEALYFESEEKANQFIDKYGCTPCTLIEQYGHYSKELFSI